MKKNGTTGDDFSRGESTQEDEVVAVVSTPYLQKRALFGPQISSQPSKQLGIIVVIPAKDEPLLLDSLTALRDADRPQCDVEVIVVINDAESDSEALKKRNQTLFEEAKKWSLSNSRGQLKFHILYHNDLLPRQAGVGLARKIGMDEAVYRFAQIGRMKAPVVCFDADALCQHNYFKAIESHFKNHPKTQACSIYYEHPVEGDAFPPEVYKAIVLYELHLRYYTMAQRFAGFPFAYETIGSSMAVRADAYQQQGGMNRRKAGEDFYFLHKFTPLGYFSEIKTTAVIPSPRRSDRVPFGTGKAVEAISSQPEAPFTTYAPQSFMDLKHFFKFVPKMNEWTQAGIQQQLDQLPSSVSAFLKTVSFEKKLFEIIANTADAAAFTHRFFRWFNAFLLMKYVHFARDHYYPNVAVEDAAIWLLKTHFKSDVKTDATALQLLSLLRKCYLEEK